MNTFRGLAAITLMLLSTSAFALQKKTFCVYDPVGKSGPAMSFFTDLKAKAIAWGLDLDMHPYTDEKVASNEFKAGNCDMVFLTAILALPYVPFGGTLGVTGGIINEKQLNVVIKSLTNPKVGQNLINGNYEMAGVLPVGSVYMFVNDQQIDTIPEFSGKRMSVLNASPQAYLMSELVGATPVGTSLATFSGQFNNGSIELLPMVALAYNTFELYQGLGEKGGIWDEMISYGMMEILTHRDRFEDGFGQKMREYMLSRVAEINRLVKTAEDEIPAKYWMKTSPESVKELNELKRKIRFTLKDKNVLNGTALTMLWKIRCSVNPDNAECATPE